jgi:NitT/TauT family transport system substrate-binding protein
MVGEEDAAHPGRSRRAVLAATGATGAGLLAGCVGGGSGDPVRTLTVGYQPYYAEAWSAVVIKHAGLAEKYLPDGYAVSSWDVALQGAIVGNRMIAGKNDVGYTGDMPTITALANDETPISAVGIAGFSEGQQCNLAVVPTGSDIESASDLDRETFGVTTGACTHRFMQRMVEAEGIDYDIRDQGINSILASVRDGSLAVGFGWEPAMARVADQEEEARYLLSGASYDIPDAAGIIMPDALLEDHPEAAGAWMKAELEAKRIMRTDPERTVDLIAQEQLLRDYDRSTIEGCLYRSLDINPDVDRMEFVTDYDAVEPAGALLRQNGPEFLETLGAIDEPPGEDRYDLRPLEAAAAELEESVAWTPAGGRRSAAASNGADATGESEGR